MDISSEVNKWYSKVKRILFKYKDGFFEFPIMSNSPESTIQSITKMPFVKHKPEEGYFGSKNPFVNADIYYHEIEKGLWFMHSTADYKENVHYNRMRETKLPSEYYNLFIEITRTESKSKNALLNGVSYSNCSWGLLKTKEGNTHCRFKGNKTTSLVVSMHQDWVNEVLFRKNTFIDSQLIDFFESNQKLIIWNEDIKIAESLEFQSNKIFENPDFKNQNDIREYVDQFIDAFLNRYTNDKIGNNLFQVSQINRKKIIQAEQYIIENIYNPFMGLDNICDKVGLSPTKLKTDFKIVFGDTVFQYFRKRQLDAAKIMICLNGQPIGEVASMFGYSNYSKFTAAYKSYFGEVPSKDLTMINEKN